jgi:integration host factor subunit alpha
VTKADLAEKIVGLGYSKKDAYQMLELVFDTMKSTLEAGEDLKISGFGNFKVRKKAPRPGRNPHTGEKLTISARRILSFKASHTLKGFINS